MELQQIGWSDYFAQAASRFPDKKLRPARLCAVNRGTYLLWDADGEWPASISGKYRHHAKHSSDYPVSGDWVMAEQLPREEKLLIHYLLPRRTALSRTAAGFATERQVLAANVDTIFVTASLAGPLNLRRIERYLTAVLESGAEAVLLLTKTDVCSDLPEALAQVRTIAETTPTLALSSVSGLGLEQLNPWLKPGRTCALIGPSGVGKSTLVNTLCGEEILPVLPVREKDQKGRHTTTLRELIRLPSGALVIDTPGLRELQLWEGQTGLNETFSDIEDLAARCRFTNCQHATEPGCQVRLALADGTLAQDRFQSYLKLQAEIDEFAARKEVRQQAEKRRKSKTVTKALQARLREKGRI